MAHCEYCKQEIRLGPVQHRCAGRDAAAKEQAEARRSAAAYSAGVVTYRELHEDAAGMGLDGSFFAVSKIDPNAPVKCNCAWDGGHEEHCDIVAANRILIQRQNVQADLPATVDPASRKDVNAG